MVKNKSKTNKEILKVLGIFSRNYQDIPLEVFTDPYRIFVSTLLSSRTKDEVTLSSSKRLFLKAPDIYKLNHLKRKTIERLIYPVGFYKTKSLNLKKASQIIIQEYQGKIPNSRETLMSLPGVGRKTANLVLNRAFNKPAIAVDIHVHRISNLMGWVKSNTPENSERQLMKIIPQNKWKDINRLFVSIGRQYPGKRKLEKFLKDRGLI